MGKEKKLKLINYFLYLFNLFNLFFLKSNNYFSKLYKKKSFFFFWLRGTKHIRILGYIEMLIYVKLRQPLVTCGDISCGVLTVAPL